MNSLSFYFSGFWFVNWMTGIFHIFHGSPKRAMMSSDLFQLKQHFRRKLWRLGKITLRTPTRALLHCKRWQVRKGPYQQQNPKKKPGASKPPESFTNQCPQWAVTANGKCDRQCKGGRCRKACDRVSSGEACPTTQIHGVGDAANLIFQGFS